MKKIFYFALCILFLFVVSYAFAVKKGINLIEGGAIVRAKIPSILIAGIFKNYEIKISSQNRENYLNILYNAFDRPLLFLPDQNNRTIFIIYFFDIENHVFAIEESASVTSPDFDRMHESLRRIVLSSSGFNIRPLTGLEVSDVVKKIGKMSVDQYRSLSVPSLDLGLYKIYMPKSKILEILQKEKDKGYE